MIGIDYVFVTSVVLFWLFCGYMSVAILANHSRIIAYEALFKISVVLLVLGGVVSLLLESLLTGIILDKYKKESLGFLWLWPIYTEKKYLREAYNCLTF